MILSDYDIMNMVKGKRMVIKPFITTIVRENGIDCRLAPEIARHKESEKGFVLDPMDRKHVEGAYDIMKGVKRMVIESHQQVLLSTYEYMEMPDDVAGLVELRSTWARHGLSMPPTIIDAGFKGTITLEVINNAPYSIMLRPKQRFAHIILQKLNNRAGSVYAGEYKGQRGIRIPKVIKPDRTA